MAAPNIFSIIRGTYSVLLLIFSIVTIHALIFTRQTKISHDVHPVLAFCLIWVAVLWLSMVEGGQGPVVGLPPVDKDLYKDSHPRTHRICSLAHKGDNLDRYLLGRQFLVVFIVFTINMSGGPLAGADILHLPKIIQNIFLNTGIVMILLTANVGQLTTQVNASRMMLDFINNYLMQFTLYVSLAIEFSGLLHSVYLVPLIVLKLAGKPVESQEEPRNFIQNVFFWARVVMSLAVLSFAYAVTLKALFEGGTTMWSGVPKPVSVILFFVFMSIVGTLEGMQIAFFAVAKLTKEEQGKHPVAMRTCHLLFKNGAINLPGFMIGRQLCVTLCFFIIARVTSLNVEVGTGNNIFGVSDTVQQLFNTGLMGSLITTICGSIAWQLVASLFPIAFCSNPLVYVLLNICLFLEATGVCSAAWVLAKIQEKLFGFQLDEVYIGTPEERAARKKQDQEDRNVEPGHMYPGVPSFPPGAVRSFSRQNSKQEEREQTEVDDSDVERGH